MINTKDDYLRWLMGIVCDEEHQNYDKLLYFLYSYEFSWIVKMDENRANDGIHLRNVFCDQFGYYPAVDGAPCSVLEMMISLSVNCSEDILWDGETNWTPIIFWSMIENLGLSDSTDSNWNRYFVDMKIGVFLERKYENDGSGGLFKLNPSLSQIPKNFKKMEIWYQMQYWISENFE